MHHHLVRATTLGVVIALATGFLLIKTSAPIAAAPSEPFLVFFDRDISEVPPSGQRILDMIAKALRPSSRVTIAGHSDTSEKSPDALSLTRAVEALRGMAKAGLPAKVSIIVSGKGTAEPMVKTPAGTPEARNRFVTITIN